MPLGNEWSATVSVSACRAELEELLEEEIRQEPMKTAALSLPQESWGKEDTQKCTFAGPYMSQTEADTVR